MKQIGTIGIVFAVLLMLSGIAGAVSLTTSANALVGDLARIEVTPASPSVTFNTTQLFAATGYDNVTGGNLVSITPTWSVEGNGTIVDTGLYTAPHAPGTDIVKATNGSIDGTATVTIPEVKSISVVETSVDFGAVSIGHASAPQSVTVTNTGNVAATVSAAPTALTSGGNTIAATNVAQSGFGPLADLGTLTGSFTLTIPAGTPLGTYTGTIDITAS